MQPAIKSSVPELHPIPVKPDIWGLVGIDLMGPFHITSTGNKYILTMTCYFSKWVEAYPLKDKTAASVAGALYKAYCQHGAPMNIITDQGSEFVNQVCIYMYIYRDCVHISKLTGIYV